MQEHAGRQDTCSSEARAAAAGAAEVAGLQQAAVAPWQERQLLQKELLPLAPLCMLAHVALVCLAVCHAAHAAAADASLAGEGQLQARLQSRVKDVNALHGSHANEAGNTRRLPACCATAPAA